ncbi:MAG: hypothetical protein K2X49_23780 [Acetobacteraceae bacterium]|nr:hypothetical protein [Acetobacteraceae bacterium]
MSEDDGARAFRVDLGSLPTHFPTHRHPAELWEALGRAVGTFGFLEESLAKAIFALTATQRYREAEIADAFRKWLPLLEHALSDPLGNLIDTFGSSARGRLEALEMEGLICNLKDAAKLRNVLCHASWNRTPDDQGRSVPYFVTRKMECFDTPIDVHFLNQVQKHTAQLACAVIETVTQLGYQFPGSNGPGRSIW